MIATAERGSIQHLPRSGASAQSDPPRVRPIVMKQCGVCGVSFFRKYNPKAMYCSPSCSVSANNRLRKDHSPETLMARFWAKVDKAAGFGPDGDCWKWTGRVNGHGYGEIKIAGMYKRSHRLALFGPEDMDNPLLACHTCDNRRCVNPAHLFAGTSLDNILDMHRKGRAVKRRARTC